MATSVTIVKDRDTSNDELIRRADLTVRSLHDMGIDVNPEDCVLRSVREYLLMAHFRDQRLAEAQAKATKALSVCFKSASPSN